MRWVAGVARCITTHMVPAWAVPRRTACGLHCISVALCTARLHLHSMLGLLCRGVCKLQAYPPLLLQVSTFYTMFNRSKMGKYHVMVCGTTPCMLQGAKGIYKALKEHLGIDYGQTTPVGVAGAGWR